MTTMSDTTNLTVRCARPDKRARKSELTTATTAAGAPATIASAATAPATDTPTGTHRTTTDGAQPAAGSRGGSNRTVADSSRQTRNGAEREELADPRRTARGPSGPRSPIPLPTASGERPCPVNAPQVPFRLVIAARLQPNQTAVEPAKRTGTTQSTR
jgi:hypothetical protein